MSAAWLALVLAGCASRAVAPPPAPPEPPRPGLTVTLRWQAPVDLDLYVTDPALETVYYANPRSASGGLFERDARCAEGEPGGRTERARWTDPPRGRYRVGVDFPETCAGSRTADVFWTLTVEIDGRRQETTGRAHLAERQPAAFEFTVAAPAAAEVP